MCVSACEFRFFGLQKTALDSLELEVPKQYLFLTTEPAPPLGKDVIFIMSQLCVNVCVCACACRDMHFQERKM